MSEATCEPHTHDWQPDDEHSDIYVARYTCECGARGYRERRRNLPGKRREKRNLPPRPIREYAFEGRRYFLCFPEAKPEPDCKPRAAGRNVTGGYLPPSSGGGK